MLGALGRRDLQEALVFEAVTACEHGRRAGAGASAFPRGARCWLTLIRGPADSACLDAALCAQPLGRRGARLLPFRKRARGQGERFSPRRAEAGRSTPGARAEMVGRLALRSHARAVKPCSDEDQSSGCSW
jgi:hypothetical protein